MKETTEKVKTVTHLIEEAKIKAEAAEVEAKTSITILPGGEEDKKKAEKEAKELDDIITTKSTSTSSSTSTSKTSSSSSSSSKVSESSIIKTRKTSTGKTPLPMTVYNVFCK